MNSILKGFQFAAKFHEILLTASLSAIVLHRIRYELAASHGVLFGFVTSGYQLSDLSFLFTSAFWSAAIARRRNKPTLHLPLAFLIVSTVALTALAGPLSAIAMIPELEWWPLHDAFSGTKSSTFIKRAYVDFWPRILDASMVRECVGGFEYMSTCPSAGYLNIYNWAGQYMNQLVPPNITMLNGGSVSRYVSATTWNQVFGWSAASTVDARTARTLRTLWEYLGRFNFRVFNIGRPIFIPSMPDGPIMKPLV